MTSTNWTDALRRLDACPDALAWAETQPDLATAWATCERADWMLWLVAKAGSSDPMSDERKPIVACCCEIAEGVLPLFERRYPGDGRPRQCLDLLRRWLGGEAVTRCAMRDAYAAYAADAAAAAATRAATDAAAAYAAAAAAAADAADAADAAGSGSLSRSADIVRRHFPAPPRIGSTR